MKNIKQGEEGGVLQARDLDLSRKRERRPHREGVRALASLDKAMVTGGARNRRGEERQKVEKRRTKKEEARCKL